MQPKQQPDEKLQPIGSDDDAPMPLTPGSTISPAATPAKADSAAKAASAPKEVTIQLSHVLKGIEPDPQPIPKPSPAADSQATPPSPVESEAGTPSPVPADQPAVEQPVPADPLGTLPAPPAEVPEESAPTATATADATSAALAEPAGPGQSVGQPATGEVQASAPEALEPEQAGPPLPPSHTPTGPLPQHPRPHKRSRRKLIGAIVLFFLVLAGAATYYYAVYMKADDNDGQYTFSNENEPVQKKAATANSWTGGADTLNWADDKNWSLGKPSNGQDIEIDVAKLPKISGSTPQQSLQNNIKDLNIGKLTFKGSADLVNASIDGQPFVVSKGVNVDVQQPSAAAAAPEIAINAPVTFSADQTVRSGGTAKLRFAPKAGLAMNITDKTISFVADDAAAIESRGTIKGTGSLVFADRDKPSGSYRFEGTSPELTGKVSVGRNNRVVLGKDPALKDAKDIAAKPAAFGTMSIEVKDGGSLQLVAIASTAVTLPNDISLSGSGLPAVGQEIGASSGALNACISKVQQGCSQGVTVNLTGKVVVVADAKLGASFSPGTPAKPVSPTVTYAIPNLTKDTKALVVVDGSLAVIK